MTSFARLGRPDLGSLAKLGKGGQATVYHAPDLTIPGEEGPFVFKEYKDKRIPISGLDGIVAIRQRLSEFDRAVLDVIANWPLRVVEREDGGAAGVIIPLIPERFFAELRTPHGTKRKPRDCQYLTQPAERCRRAGVPFEQLGDRYRCCRELSFALAFLHRRGLCFGDLSFANIAYALDTFPGIYLMDCDAVRKAGSAPVVPQFHTPDWVPPEGAAVQSEKTDRYKLGLFILRVLAPDFGSAQMRDPAKADQVLDAEGRTLLRRALARDAAARPEAVEWYRYFNTQLKTRPMARTKGVSRMPERPVPATP